MTTSAIRHTIYAALLTLAFTTPAFSQMLPPPSQVANLSGPRFGMTVLPEAIVQELAAKDILVTSNITQFGWQFEKQFFTSGGGVTMVTEWVGLIGGLEQSVALPSLSWLVGIRTRDGAEFGIGPNITPAGRGLVLTGGITFRTSSFNVPVNVAFVPSKFGSRVTVLTGFSLR